MAPLFRMGRYLRDHPLRSLHGLVEYLFPATELPVTFEFRKASEAVKKSHLLMAGGLHLPDRPAGTPLVFDARSITCRGDLCIMDIPVSGRHVPAHPVVS